MGEVASRDLRNTTRAVLERVTAGEEVVITVDGRPVAKLVPLAHRTRWMPKDAFVRDVLPHQADPDLGTDLRDMVPDTTDDER